MRIGLDDQFRYHMTELELGRLSQNIDNRVLYCALNEILDFKRAFDSDVSNQT